MKTKIFIRKAKIEDVQNITHLIEHYARKGLTLRRSEDYLIQNLRDFLVAYNSQKEFIACGALHLYTNRLSEIKSLVVKPEYHGQGIGKKIVRKCLNEAKNLGLRKVFVLTYQEKFFQKLKFTPSDRNLLPDKIWQECSICAKKEHCDEKCLVYLISNS